MNCSAVKSFLEGKTEINEELIENENNRLNENLESRLEQLADELDVDKKP